MVSLLTSLAIVLGTAWLGRMFLDARELTWGRLVLAAVVGIGVGDAAALFLLISDIDDVATINYEQLQLVSLPFRIIATMGAIVVLELFFRRRRPPASTARFGAGLAGGSGTRALLGGRALLRPRVLARGLEVFRILARHGFTPLLGWGTGRGESLDQNDLARRLRLALEEAGGVFIKLGQLLATRPDLLPPAVLAELGRLQSSVAPLERSVVKAQIEAELGSPLGDVFAHIEWEPLGSASIAQAHGAVLLDGTEVVIKVRRPGLEKVIDRDLAIMSWLARSVEGRYAWARQLRLTRLAAEFAEALVAELEFDVEARHIAEMESALAGQSLITVPRVVPTYTRRGLIVMERLAGTPLAKVRQGDVPTGHELADALCASQVGAMLDGRRFHGDPHAGNVLLLDDGRLGLIDMGITSRLDTFERAAVFQMLLALRLEQPALLVESMATIGALDPAIHDPLDIERAMARFMAAYLMPGLPPGRALTDLLRLTLDLGLVLPPSTSAMFRALATLSATLEQLAPGYPIIEKIAELGGDEFTRKLMPTSVVDFVKQEWSELGPMIRRLPRQVDRLATMLEHGRLGVNARLLADGSDRRFIERLLNRFVLTLLSLATGVVAVMLLGLEGGFQFPWFGVGLYQVLGWLGLFMAMTLLFRVLLAVLRSESAPDAGR